MNGTLIGNGMSSMASVYFDAMDKARELLEGHKDLSKAIPSCVVVGMQSVGKSAVLSRVSGIPFPQHSEVCTRVAMELRLRRCASDDGKKMQIYAGSTPVVVGLTSNKSIESALKQAQADILKGKAFEDKISVKIDKVQPNLPEVTLVDLPGIFFAKTEASDDLEAKVKEMIKERVNNPMSLICHVVPLNQDTERSRHGVLFTMRTTHKAGQSLF